MLLQGQTGEINLFPDKWHTGKVTGLRAKGNFEVDMNWERGELVSARIQAFSAGHSFLCYRDQIVSIVLEPKCMYTIDRKLNIIKRLGEDAV
jgi:alpha-L-fucosidase 2